MPRELHPQHGVVFHYSTGNVACSDCGYDGHRGPCRFYHCRTCNVECSESGCAKHPKDKIRVTIVERVITSL